MASEPDTKNASETHPLDRNLEQIATHIDRASTIFFWIALMLSALAFVALFLFVQVFAILPYITVVHTGWAGLGLGAAGGGIVYFVATAPMDAADTAWWSVWLTRKVLNVARKVQSRVTASKTESG